MRIEVKMTSEGVKHHGEGYSRPFKTREEAEAAYKQEFKKFEDSLLGAVVKQSAVHVFTIDELFVACAYVSYDPWGTEVSTSPAQRLAHGWRAQKGPMANNKSGFRATGHRLLLSPDVVEEVSAGGIVLPKKAVKAEQDMAVIATVVEIGYDAWSDKSTDYCDVGDRVLIGQYVGKFHESPVDGKLYRFVNDLDIISPIEKVG